VSVLSDEQKAVIDYLGTHLRATNGSLKVITTHVSVIFLSGNKAYKMKRAVKFPFLDFQNLAARREACEKEIEINCRTAPTLYLGVVPITVGNDGFELGGAGKPVEWLVEMNRFDEDTQFDRLAGIERGLRRPIIEDLADVIAVFRPGENQQRARRL
jgi:uncharacterized protein